MKIEGRFIMGQRSQIYIRFPYGDNYGLIAKYYQWNYGEQMISRCRYGIEWILERMEYIQWFYLFKDNIELLSEIFDVNFDMYDVSKTCDIIKEFHDYFPEENFNNWIFKQQDNNDGQLFIDIRKSGVYYSFIDNACDIDNIMDAEGYMEWNNDPKDWRNSKYISKDQKLRCERNIRYISKRTKLMTLNELEYFITCDYSKYYHDNYLK